MLAIKRTSLVASCAALIFAGSLAAFPARAQEVPTISDEITFSVTERIWIKAAKAKVVSSINIAMDADKAKTLRATVSAALSKIAPNAEWRLTSFNRQPDKTGLERWRIQAQARVGETDLAGLETRARKVSGPGMQVRIAQVAFTPSPEEVEAARKDLRAQIYTRVIEERAVLANNLPERKFRIGSIDFSGTGPRPPLMKAQARDTRMMMTEAANAGGADLNTGRELVQTAYVRLVSSTAN